MSEESALPARPWRRGLAWLLFLGPFFFLSYGFANAAAAKAGVSHSIVFGWERYIPFLPWTIMPYWSIDLCYGLSFLCWRTREEVDRHGFRLLAAQIVCVICFLLFPLRFSHLRPAVGGPWGAMFDALASFDQPYNQAPSLHIALLALLWAPFAGLRTGPWLKAFIHVWALLIGISVLTTWQHHFADVPTGAAVGLLCLWLWPDADQALPWRRPLARDFKRWRLAGVYGAGAALLLGLALVLRGGWIWLAWPALALAMVALCYAWFGGQGFQTQDGRPSLAVRVLLLPYLLGARFNAWFWTRKRPGPDRITDRVWLGRSPSRADLEQGGFAGLCNLAPEMTFPRGTWVQAAFPWIDLMPVPPEALRAAAESIEVLQDRGPTLVACALGYSRSAAAVAAWLHWRGTAPTMDDAIALVQARRPEVVLGPEWRASLDALLRQDRRD